MKVTGGGQALGYEAEEAVEYLRHFSNLKNAITPMRAA